MKKLTTFTLSCILAMTLAACTGTGSNKTSDSQQPGGAITIASADATAKDGFDAFMKPNDTITVTATYSGKAAAGDYYWAGTPSSLFTITPAEDGKSASIKAKAEGDGYVTVTIYGKGGADDIVSNQLKVRIEGDHKTNADFQYALNSYKDAGNNDIPLTYNTLYKNSGNPHMNSVGGAHVLVIPLGFQEADIAQKQTSAALGKINKTFFGTTEEMQELGSWESLRSFYRKSSYGISDFDGYIPENWCVWDKADSETCSGGVAAAEYGRTWYIREYAKANHGALGANAPTLDWFDSDKDGFIDLIWVVYSHKTVSNNTQWWAYVTYTGNGSSLGSPNVKTLGWASLDWMGGGYDAHTYIHETGHTYGLNDYYDYNNTWSPMGGIDFMDHNMGDHCMYSKWLLAWTKPLVVNDSALITLRPGTTTGDCFILPSPGYNNTVFDEYMMFELMAPVGLAEADYKAGYSNVPGYSKPGIRVTHVDARVYRNDRNTYAQTLSEVINSHDIRVDNSYAGRGGLYNDSDYFPILDANGKEVRQNYYTETSLMESSFTETNNWKVAGHNASNSSLFTAGNIFNLSNKKGWAKAFMPSETNLWNKAKTITGWAKDHKSQTYTIDETCTFNYEVKVLSIDEDPTYGYTARVLVTKDAAVYN